jgi:hypothetical protein
MITFLLFRKQIKKEDIIKSILFAFALLFASLLLIRPTFKKNYQAGSGLLLSEDVSNIPDSIPVYALPGVKSQGKVIMVPDIAFIERNHPEILQLYISGKNIPPEQLKNVKRIKVIFLDQEISSGFSWISYNRNLKEGENLQVNGTYINDMPDSVMLKLNSAEGMLDSVYLPPGRNSFSMSGNLEIPGNFIGRMEVNIKDSLRYEPLPYVISSRRPLQILMIQAYPSFELNYLKDWLSEQGHSIHVRVQISQNKFAYQYINREKDNSNAPLSETNLEAMDIIIADAASIKGLKNAEQKRIEKAVKNGLGILVLADESRAKSQEVLGIKFPIISSGSFLLVSNPGPILSVGNKFAICFCKLLI